MLGSYLKLFSFPAGNECHICMDQIAVVGLSVDGFLPLKKKKEKKKKKERVELNQLNLTDIQFFLVFSSENTQSYFFNSFTATRVYTLYAGKQNAKF